jgi:hypothetical protein
MMIRQTEKFVPSMERIAVLWCCIARNAPLFDNLTAVRGGFVLLFTPIMVLFSSLLCLQGGVFGFEFYLS